MRASPMCGFAKQTWMKVFRAGNKTWEYEHGIHICSYVFSQIFDMFVCFLIFFSYRCIQFTVVFMYVDACSHLFIHFHTCLHAPTCFIHLVTCPICSLRFPTCSYVFLYVLLVLIFSSFFLVTRHWNYDPLILQLSKLA